MPLNHNSSDDEILKVIQENERAITFILYRLEIKDDSLKYFALHILKEFPERAINATKYLSLFEDDVLVIQALFEIAITSPYTQVSLHCIQALIKICGYSEDIIEVLKTWASSASDWYLRREALALLEAQTDLSEFFWNIILNEENENVLAKGLEIAFAYSATIEEKIRVINVAFSDKRNSINLVGVYLWRRQADILRNQVHVHLLSTELDDFILTIDENNAKEKFRKNFSKVFGFEVSANARFHLHFNIIEANQCLIDILDAETNMKRYIEAFYTFTNLVLLATVKIDYPNINGTDLLDILEHLDAITFFKIANLRNFYDLSKKKHVPPIEKKMLLPELKIVHAINIGKLHEHQNLTLPNSLKKFLATNVYNQQQGQNMNKPKVFLSYARQDKDTVLEIYTFLKENGCDTWMDVKNILPGQAWEYEIERAIENSNYFIACLSTHSVNHTGYVQTELKKALKILDRFPEGKIFLIPIKLDNCPIPPSLSGRQCADWLDEEERAKMLHSILRE